MKITKSKKGLYRCRVYIGRDKDGKTIQKVFSDADKARLRLRISEYLDAHRSGSDLGTFAAAMDTFIDIKTPVLSPATIREYVCIKRILLNQFPDFCRLSLPEIRQNHVQEIVNHLVSDGKSPKTVRNYVGFISSVMSSANYRIPKVTLPQKIRPEYNVPDEETMKAVMRAAAGTDLEVPLSLAVFGLRRGEICALRVEDIDKNIVHVHRALVRDASGNQVEKTTKTYESDRYVQIPNELADKIREQGYVTNLSLKAFTRRFIRLLQREDIEHFRLHDLRHFFVSYCHNVLKLSDAQIQKMGGWKTDYVMKAHYLQSMNDKQAGMLVANRMKKIIG